MKSFAFFFFFLFPNFGLARHVAELSVKNHIAQFEEYLTPLEKGVLEVKVFEHGESLDLTDAEVIWGNPQNKVIFVNQQGGQVSVIPTAQDGHVLEMTVVTANVTVNNKRYDLFTYSSIFRPWGQEAEAPNPASEYLPADETSIGTIWDCYKGAPNTYFYEELWDDGDGEYRHPNHYEAMWKGWNAELRIVSEHSIYRGAYWFQFSPFDREVVDIYDAHILILQHPQNCATGLSYETEMGSWDWVSCIADYKRIVIRDFFRKFNYIYYIDGTDVYLQSYRPIEGGPAHIQWRFSVISFPPTDVPTVCS
eukprot:Gregarina_sp_Pseudo_9__5871@NODE_916_length_2063_cov_235_510870_g860_i0_p1_GENE_NODE_916_length_2063_cov_235_510870_g860_i0NODE_916_length_2063_cov_235_510870_g860_i0_p1_ORF_typecomplete_len308_score20_67_NODE_916_length_2063_cov_235_510870_g860_i014937